jgi:hypothetical protein
MQRRDFLVCLSLAPLLGMGIKHQCDRPDCEICAQAIAESINAASLKSRLS